MADAPKLPGQIHGRIYWSDCKDALWATKYTKSAGESQPAAVPAPSPAPVNASSSGEKPKTLNEHAVIKEYDRICGRDPLKRRGGAFIDRFFEPCDR